MILMLGTVWATSMAGARHIDRVEAQVVRVPTTHGEELQIRLLAYDRDHELRPLPRALKLQPWAFASMQGHVEPEYTFCQPLECAFRVPSESLVAIRYGSSTILYNSSADRVFRLSVNQSGWEAFPAHDMLFRVVSDANRANQFEIDLGSPAQPTDLVVHARPASYPDMLQLQVLQWGVLRDWVQVEYYAANLDGNTFPISIPVAPGPFELLMSSQDDVPLIALPGETTRCRIIFVNVTDTGIDASAC